MKLVVDFCSIRDYESLEDALNVGIGRYCMQDGWGWDFEVSYRQLRKLSFNRYNFIQSGANSLMCTLAIDPDESCAVLSDVGDKIT